MMDSLLTEYGLLFLAIALFLDAFILVLPTSTTLFAASIYVHQTQPENIWIVFLIAVTVIPTSHRIVFEFGKRGGRRWIIRHGGKFLLSYKRLIKAEKFIEQYGQKTIFFTSIFPTVSPVASLIAGSLNMKGKYFGWFNFLGVCTSAAFVIGTAYIWGENIWAVLSPYKGYIILAIFIYPVLKTASLILKYFFMTQKVLLIGNGGRENALANALMRSSKRVKIYHFAPALNPDIQKVAFHSSVGDINDPSEVLKYAQSFSPDFCIVGPENPIQSGVVDLLEESGIPCVAPNKKCAQIETSKGFTRELLARHNIKASPDFYVSREVNEKKTRQDFFEKHNGQIVVKADGLMGGKGVIVAGDHFDKFEIAEDFAQKALKKFGRVVFEEKLVGEEFSLISFTDGKTVLDGPAIQDHKRAYEDDQGPNTGGMGCISDERGSLPFLTKEDLETAHQINVQTIQALQKETGETYKGFLFGGFMKTKNGIRLIEYNARLGDPEALILLPLLLTDFVEICEKIISQKLDEIKILEFRKKAAVLKYLCPEGYPENPLKNVPFTIDKNIPPQDENHKFYYASVQEKDGQLLLLGSRSIGVLGVGDTLSQAYERCESLIPFFKGPFFYRHDIGTPKLTEKRIQHIKSLTSSNS